MRKSNIWIIKLVFCLLCGLLGGISLWAQDKDVVKKKMLEIKLDEDFIFGEGTSDNKDLAYGDALEDLLSFVNEIKNRNSQEELRINDLVTNVETIVYQSGTRYEVMVYIPVKIVIDTNRQTSSAKEELKKLTEEAPVAETKAETVVPQEEIVVRTMIAQEEVATEPAASQEEIPAKTVDAPQQEVTAEPVTPQEEVTAETGALQEEVTAESEVPQEEVTAETVVEVPQEEIVVETAAPQEEVTAETVEAPQEEVTAVPVTPQEAATTVNEPAEEVIPKTVTVSMQEEDELEEFLITQENFAEIKSYLSEMKRSGKITETGAADSISGLPQDASLILIDELGGLLAILSPVKENGRINYKTKKSDSEKNYNSKFIVWYRK